MEKTKYISANDFFPINYSMLFNVSHAHVHLPCSRVIRMIVVLLFNTQMGAAIVTHMLVLLQFQQWEDNQNLLFEENSRNGTTLPDM